jgi:hypothetical protein
MNDLREIFRKVGKASQRKPLTEESLKQDHISKHTLLENFIFLC